MSDRTAQLNSRRASLEMVRQLLDDAGISPVDRPKFVAAGADYTVYSTRVEFGGESRDVVVRLPRSESRDGQSVRARRAVSVQNLLGDRELSFRVPEPLETFSTDDGLAVVETEMPGVELADSTDQRVDPVEMTAEVAAECHGIDDPALRRLLGGPLDCRGHGFEAMRIFDDVSTPEIEKAGQWCSNHLPGERPASFLHGDLLAQNLLVGGKGQTPGVAVVDWDDVRFGDPVFDLASVTRGYETIFGTGESRTELIEVYNRIGERKVDEERLLFWELVVLGREFKNAEGSRSEWLNGRIRRLLDRIEL